MMDVTRQTIAVVALLLLCTGGAGSEPAADETPRGTPTPEQIAWHELEITMFVHWHPGTWQGREYDNRSTPLDQINPSELDTDQWCRVARSFGAKLILFVAKHVGDFCWWQTDTTEYSIKNTPWKNGKGDVLSDLSRSCEKYGLKLGIYVYPGNEDLGAGIGSGGRTKDPAKQKEADRIYRQQMTEVLSRYGAITEVWFDGSCITDVKDIIDRHAPGAMILQSPHATLRWPGNEAGISPYPAWQTVEKQDALTGVSTSRHSDPDGDVWLPMEMDVPLLNHKWLWAPNTDHMMRSVNELMDIYYKSVGRGGVLLLNSTPDTTGRIPDTHVERYREFGEAIRRIYANKRGDVSGTSRTLELRFGRPTPVNHLVTMEDIRHGHIVRAYEIDGLIDGAWRSLVEGSSIGYKKIDVIPTVDVEALRFRATETRGIPVIHSFAAYNAPVPGIVPVVGVKASSSHVTGQFPPENTADGDHSTRWASVDGAREGETWLEFEFEGVREIDGVRWNEGWNRVQAYHLQHWEREQWQTFFHGKTMAGETARFTPVETERIRVVITSTTNDPTIWEIEFLRHPDEHGASAGWRTVTGFRTSQLGREWLALDIDLTPHIPKPGQYEVRFRQPWASPILKIKDAVVVMAGTEAPRLITALDRPLRWNINRTAQVTSDKQGRTTLRIVARLVGDGIWDGELVIRRVE